MKRIITFISIAFLTASVFAQQVNVKLKPDASYTNKQLVEKMESNLSKVLTEINAAHQDKRPLNLVNAPMSKFAKDGLGMLWANIYFYCDDEYVVDRLWNFADGFMARSIPVIITPEGETFGSGTFQEAVVEFDKNGMITDFRFAIDAAVGESMEQGGDAVDIERRMQILAYCDRFRTAYNTKDINFLEQVFSDDALIITGKVVTMKNGDMTPQSKVVYNKQTKVQYLNNLRRAFARNKWIEVKFSQIGEHGEGNGEQAITRSTENPNIYGVRLRQEWNSSNYSDEGYVFLLWDFTDEQHPVIHIRTWQPEYLDSTRNKKISRDELFGIDDFVK